MSLQRNTALLISAYLVFLVLLSQILEKVLDDDSEIELIDFEKLQCEKMFQGDKLAMERGSLFQFDDLTLLARILNSTDNKCVEFQRLFQFFKKPMSDEENEFPLAYGMLIHDNFVQIALLLSAIYQPQNQFCLAIDGNSTEEFVGLIRMLSSCYPNIHYFVTEEIRWCGYEILTSVFKCVEFLTLLSDSDWKYFQYLSGVDAPLKSNLEMVRIFKALNGSFNAEIDPFEYYRLNGKRPWKSPLKLYKTSLSATFSRESANFMVSSEKVREQIEFLRGTECADESLWATIAGNPSDLKMPGGFDAKPWLRNDLLTKFHSNISTRLQDNNNISSYYISRYQQYVNRAPAKCKGYFYRFSCVFGVFDLPNLIRRHELIAHKLYFTFQPAAFLCLVENARRKTILQTDRNFTAEFYKDLPNAPRRVVF